jgi:hypothetical protein
MPAPRDFGEIGKKLGRTMRHRQKARYKAERKAEREARGKWWFVDRSVWSILGLAGVFGLLGYLWHPLWALARVLFLGWVVLWVLGWLWVLGSFAVDTGSRFFKR